MPSKPLRLSKSRYLSGLQCHKQLWWRVHEPEAPELVPTRGQENLFAQGKEVGARARAQVPGGELIDLPFYEYDNKVAATREALNRGLPAIYEAWFLAEDTYAGVDILARDPGAGGGGRGHVVIEVKASNSRKPEHLPDAAVQVHLLPRAGLQVEPAQVKAVQTGRMVVEETLKKALLQFASPLAFLDFETVSLAIPRWPGCRPWQQVPVQFSVHAEERGRGLIHHEWIADGPGDPRPALAEALVEACAGARRVVAYYASFERECIRQLREAVPQLGRGLERIERRLVDLLPTVRNHVYHPDFGGRFSIQKTLPALVPGLSYSDLKVRDGEVATVELQRLMLAGTELPASERAELRQAWLRYCERDTWAMVKMLEKLRSLVADQLELF